MDTPETTQNTAPKGPKRKVLFLIGIILGLLIGAALMLFVVDWLDYRRPREVRILRTAAPDRSKDTVVNVVIHRHVNPYDPNERVALADSTDLDSLMEDDATQDLYMDEDVTLMEGGEDEKDVYTPKMLDKFMQKVIFLDHNKKEIPAPSDHASHIQIQKWNTLVRNRYIYQFSGDVLIIKGVDFQSLKVIHWNNAYYLVCAKHVYKIHPNNQYEYLVETHEVAF